MNSIEFRKMLENYTPADKGYVYLIVDEYKMYLKIGHSKNPIKRLFNLQCNNPMILSLLYIIESEQMSILELSLLREFKPLLKRGEWFHYNDSIIEKFKELQESND